MGEVCVDYLDTYRQFFDRFTSSVDPSDQLPVKVAGYNLVESEIPGATADWTLQYLEQRKCPPSLIAHLIRKVVEEVRVLSKIDPISCGFRGHEIDDYLSLRLMQVCIAKLVDVCSRYRDNAELSTLPPPQPLPPVTSCAIKNSRRSMEDRHVVIHDFHTLFNIKGWGPASYYGVLDGHNGMDAAIYSVSHLHQYLAESPHYPADPVKALYDACCKTDEMFTTKAEKENLHGGTTAVVALLRQKEQKLYVAWLGDSQAVLVRQGRPIQIVRPHKPDRPDEKDRIEGMGGTVIYWGAWRVNGQLAVSRAIGDVEYKPYVSAKPDIEEITLDGTEDFLILACDGLWDFVSEQQATTAVYKQLQENPEDLEAVSHRLVALSKEQSSQDNISVVVVFLTDPAELAKRPPMETPIPNPFNGAEMFNGQSHHRTPVPFDEEDFGPETDVDMVDDVLLSPAIAAAKALVHGANEDDYERQRQQMKEFDDPGDLERSRDTPTPPAHEVVRDASADNIAESGGEESEEEWNYIPGNDTKNEPKAQAQSKEEEDMNSQLNPNAAEFVPVSPKRLLMDDPIIASSPARGFEKSLDNIQIPSELEFCSEISHRPSDLEYSNGPKQGEDCLDNLSTLHIQGKGLNIHPDCTELASESNVNLIEENVSFDKLAALQNMEEKISSAVLEKAKAFGVNNDFINNAFEATNIFGKSDPMTASFMGKDLPSSPEPEDNLIPGTPHSTTVEAPTSPPTYENSPTIHHTELDSPVDDFAADMQKSPDLISPGDGPHDGLISTQERTSSSGFESESGADEIETNVSNERNISEHKITTPVDMNFQSIQTLSDTNPFGSFQNPNPLDQSETLVEANKELPLQTPKKDLEAYSYGDAFDVMKNAPSSFVSPRTQLEGDLVPFEQLESPKDHPNFVHPPDTTDLPKSPVIPDEIESLSQVKSETDEYLSDNYKTNVNDITQELFFDNTDVKETSFLTEKPQNSDGLHVDLDSTGGFLETEAKIMQDELDCEMNFKQEEDIKISCDLSSKEISSPLSPKAVDKVLAAFDDIKLDEHNSALGDQQELSRDSDIEVETKEMKLEFESHIANSQDISEESKDEGFEIISKEELSHDVNQLEALKKESEQIFDPSLSGKETNPFMIDENPPLANPMSERQELPVEIHNTTNEEYFNSHDQSSAVGDPVDVKSTEKLNQLSSTEDPLPHAEPEVTKEVSYQTLTPANEPQITKVESYITGVKEESNFSVSEDIIADKIKPVKSDIPAGDEKSVFIQENTAALLEAQLSAEESDQKSHPVQSTTVTETLITALEEKSEVLSATITEVPSSAGTPPPTPAPELNDSKELEDTPKTDILVAAVAAAGAVAAGSAILAEKETKKTKDVTTKKSAVNAKKPSDVTSKPTAKSTTAKTLTTKPATTKTSSASATTKSLTATKPLTTTNKLAPSKTSVASTAAKKTMTAASATASKPAQQKVASTATATKQSTLPLKSVPKQLPLTKTTPSSPKPLSKPSTPSSKPTTPTTVKSPMLKSDSLKSPSKPGLKSPLTPKTLAPKSATEKKPLTNGDIKPLVKKSEVPKKPTTTTTMKTSVTKSTVSKTSLPAIKSAAPLNATKPKPPSATALKLSNVTTKRPNTAPSGKIASGKEPINKQVPRAKPGMNGKSATTTKTLSEKKTESKLNAAKPEIKPPPIKKPDDLKKEEKLKQLQEAAVTTTTNGFADHNEDQESLKIEDLAPVTVEILN